MSTALRAIVLAMLLTAGVVAAGVVLIGGEDEEPEAAPPSYEATPLASYDTSSVAVPRSGFCDRLPVEAVTDALGAEPTDEETYDNGEPAALARRVDDVAHEYGCRLDAGEAVARAWVFAPPVAPARARELVALAGEETGCAPLPEGEEYGDPSVALVCDGKARRAASYRGLFGDAWLSCSLSLPGDPPLEDLRDRLGRWCVAVAQAASAPR